MAGRWNPIFELRHFDHPQISPHRSELEPLAWCTWPWPWGSGKARTRCCGSLLDCPTQLTCFVLFDVYICQLCCMTNTKMRNKETRSWTICSPKPCLWVILTSSDPGCSQVGETRCGKGSVEGKKYLNLHVDKTRGTFLFATYVFVFEFV